MLIALFLFLFLVLPSYTHSSNFFGAYQSQQELVAKHFKWHSRSQNLFDVKAMGLSEFDKNRDFLQVEENWGFSNWSYVPRFIIVSAGSLPITTLLATTTLLAVPNNFGSSKRAWVTLGTGLSLSAVVGIIDLIIHFIVNTRT